MLSFQFSRPKIPLNFAEMIDGIELLNTEPEMFLPDDLNITDAGAKKEAGECLKKFYFGDKQVSKEDLNMYTDVIIFLVDLLRRG